MTPTEVRYRVTVKIDGREDWTTEVSALDEWKARTRAMASYTNDHRLSGEFVDYDVYEVSA